MGDGAGTQDRAILRRPSLGRVKVRILFNVPERSLYLTVSSWFRISFVIGESSGVMLLNRTGGVVWALKPP